MSRRTRKAIIAGLVCSGIYYIIFAPGAREALTIL